MLVLDEADEMLNRGFKEQALLSTDGFLHEIHSGFKGSGFKVKNSFGFRT